MCRTNGPLSSFSVGPCLPFGSHPTPVCSPVLRAAPWVPQARVMPAAQPGSCPTTWSCSTTVGAGLSEVFLRTMDLSRRPWMGLAVAVCGLGTLYGASSTLPMTESVQLPFILLVMPREGKVPLGACVSLPPSYFPARNAEQIQC